MSLSNWDGPVAWLYSGSKCSCPWGQDKVYSDLCLHERPLPRLCFQEDLWLGPLQERLHRTTVLCLDHWLEQICSGSPLPWSHQQFLQAGHNLLQGFSVQVITCIMERGYNKTNLGNHRRLRPKFPPGILFMGEWFSFCWLICNQVCLRVHLSSCSHHIPHAFYLRFPCPNDLLANEFLNKKRPKNANTHTCSNI